MKRLYTYFPDDPIFCGDLGYHQATFIAEIESEQNRFGWSYAARIMKVTIELKFGEAPKKEVDVTPAFLALSTMREFWERQILHDYKSHLNRDPDDVEREERL